MDRKGSRSSGAHAPRGRSSPRWQARIVGVQGAYYALTGLWPLVHLGSFEAITGPKSDDWLVRMVGLLAIAIGATLIAAVVRGRTGFLEVIILAVGSALAFAGVDLWYGLNGRISPVYLGDAVVELGFVALLGLTGRIDRSADGARRGADLS